MAATFSDEVTESEKPNSPDLFEMSVYDRCPIDIEWFS